MILEPQTKLKVLTEKSRSVTQDPDSKHQRAMDCFVGILRKGEIYTTEELQHKRYQSYIMADISENNANKFAYSYNEFIKKNIYAGILEVA